MIPPDADLVARIDADEFSRTAGRPIVVDNITGAAGNIATNRLVKASPDVYTIAIMPNLNVTIAPFTQSFRSTHQRTLCL